MLIDPNTFCLRVPLKEFNEQIGYILGSKILPSDLDRMWVSNSPHVVMSIEAWQDLRQKDMAYSTPRTPPSTKKEIKEWKEAYKTLEKTDLSKSAWLGIITIEGREKPYQSYDDGWENDLSVFYEQGPVMPEPNMANMAKNVVKNFLGKFFRIFS